MEALGLVVWPMAEFEADDALATAAARWAESPNVGRIWICTPDKDLAQCVRDERVVLRDRRRRRTIDRAGVLEHWGVAPESIPDYLALVGDSADGFPGLPGWGARSASAVLARHVHLEAIPEAPGSWGVTVRSPATLNAVLREHWSEALLYGCSAATARPGRAALARRATRPFPGLVRGTGARPAGAAASPLAGLSAPSKPSGARAPRTELPLPYFSMASNSAW
jgi:hypothetical protein